MAAPIAKVAGLLEQEYGLSVWMPRKGVSPLDILIGTILSQNTSDRNSRSAFKNLRRRFPSWGRVLAAREDEIERAIRSAGLSRIKARRIKGVLAEIKRRTGRLSLASIAGKKPAEARAWLMSLEGVGPKTAAVVLIFGFGMPVFPVDTHILRVSKRLGWIPKGASLEKAHELLDKEVPDRLKLSLHLNMIRHGRQVCTARRPLCEMCLLNRICPSAFRFPHFRGIGHLR